MKHREEQQAGIRVDEEEDPVRRIQQRRLRIGEERLPAILRAVPQQPVPLLERPQCIENVRIEVGVDVEGRRPLAPSRAAREDTEREPRTGEDKRERREGIAPP